ncbi:Immunoglobulin heavy variable 3-66 [Dissostichus eleginoides]|nr:Immunoglobulin heavy variable 3-66 [Dissostichus eleginoides]
MVLQSGDQMSQPGSKVTFECRMGDGLSMSSNTMFWYQDHPGAAVQFLTKEYDEAAGNLVSSIDPSQNTFSLHISGLQLSDSSTYYCAAKHSAALRAETRTDNRPLQLEHRLIWFLLKWYQRK